MKNNKVKQLLDSLPTTAAALGDALGVKVQFGGSPNSTTGTIILPHLKEDCSIEEIERFMASFVHETGHIKHTNFRCHGSYEAEQLLCNVAEDIRMEILVAKEYPGFINLRKKSEAFLMQGWLDGLKQGRYKSMEKLLAYLLFYGSYHCDKKLYMLPACTEFREAQDFPEDVVEDCEKIILEVDSATSTKDSLNIAKRIIERIKEFCQQNSQNSQGQGGGQSENSYGIPMDGEGQSGDGQGQSNGENQSNDANSQNGASSQQESAQLGDGQQGNNSSQGGSQENAQQSGSDNGNQSGSSGSSSSSGNGNSGENGSSDSQSQSNSSSSGNGGKGGKSAGTSGNNKNGSGQRSKPNFNVTPEMNPETCSLTDDFDTTAQYQKQLNEIEDRGQDFPEVNLKDLQDNGLSQARKTEKDLQNFDFSQLNSSGKDYTVEALALANRTKRSLQMILNTQSRANNRISQSGRRLSAKRIYRAATDDFRVFQKRGVETSHKVAFQILLDRSGSMDSRFESAVIAAVAAYSAAVSVPEVTSGISVFPSYYGDENGYDVVIPHGREKLASFRKGIASLQSYGSTPFFEALIKTKFFFDNCKADRKILLVLTDACFSNFYQIKSFIKDDMEKKSGIEIAAIGIGGATKSLERAFSNFTLLEGDDIQKLPEAVMTVSKQLVSKAIA